jgi:hypothetical protein
MYNPSLPIGILAIGFLAGATAAQGGIETWVSGTGTDAGTCPIAAPCRTFAYAHTQTNNNGSINVLTSGNFGPVTINKSISIVAQGVEAVINTPSNGAGVIVNANAGAVVSLRGLTIDMRGSASFGVFFATGAALHVHGCIIRRGFEGIRQAPSSGASELYVADTAVEEQSSDGIMVRPAGTATARAVLERVRVENGASRGITFSPNNSGPSIVATVRDSVSAGNVGAGIIAEDPGSTSVKVMVSNTTSGNNGIGVSATGAGAIIRIGNATVTGNTTGLSASGGQIVSYGSNKVDGNGSGGAPTSTIATK